MDRGRLSIGCPFWSFAEWNGSLYPEDARPPDRLRQYARVFDTVEGNTTFYATPSARTARRWRDEVPPGFRFCFKLPRAITHDLALRDARDETARFLEAMEPLADRLGPYMIQLPAGFGPARAGDLERFLDGLPREPRFAVELRHRAFFDDADEARRVDALLEGRGCERVIMDTRALNAGDPTHPEVRDAVHEKPKLPVRPRALGPTPLVRFVAHPDASVNEPYLEEWAERLGGWIDEGRHPYFFAHTPSNRRAPELARELHRRVSERTALPPLPAFPGETGERADGQLSLL